MMTRRRLLTAMAGGSTMLLAPGARAELDGGVDNYLIYKLAQSGATIGQVLVTNTEGDGYGAATEYWYMTANVAPRAAVTLTPGTSQSWTNPPSGLGTLSFTMANTTTWSRGTRSGTIYTYNNEGTGEYEGMQWAMSESGGVWSGSITWWQLGDTGTLFAPGGGRILTPVVASGTAYYIVNSPI
jgi:hypothetical protein